MAIRLNTPTLLPVLLGTLALAAGCTFDPPGSVLSNGNDNRPDAMEGGGGADASVTDGGGGGAESMTINFTTTPGGVGPYTPKNIVAAWIEDPNGNYVSTIYRHSAGETGSLKAWGAVSPVPSVDIVSGATKLNHNTPISATWDIGAAALPDGEYTIRIETCEVNANGPGDNAQGTFTFNKNGTASSLTPTDPRYLDVSVEYTGR